MIVDGDAVLQGGEIIARSDDDGYMEIDLYRTGHYAFIIQGFETDYRAVVVPDAPSVNIVDLLFPVITSIVFDPSPALIAVDEVLDVMVTVLSSDGQTVDIADEDLLFTSSDRAVVSCQVVDSKLRIVGIAAGSAEISAERADSSIVVIPDEPTTYEPLSVTVS